jgi:hypothetical protein
MNSHYLTAFAAISAFLAQAANAQDVAPSTVAPSAAEPSALSSQPSALSSSPSAPVAAASSPSALSSSPSAASRPSFSSRLPDLRVGPFDIHPRLVTGVMYDDNIYISSHDAKSDFIWSVQPAASIVAGDRQAITEYKLSNRAYLGLTPGAYITAPPEYWPGMLLTLDYGPRFNWFTDYSENDSTDHLLHFTALAPFSKLIVGVSQDYTSENTSVVEAQKRSSVETITSAIMGAYQFSEKTSAEMNLSRKSTDYEAKQGLYGNTDWSDANWFNYHMTPLFNVSAGLTVGDLETQDQSQTYEQLLARARYDLAERVSVGASAGGEWRQFEETSDSLEPIFSLDGNYRPFDRTSIYLSGYRRDQASVYYSQNYIITGIGGGINQQFGDRYFIGLGLSYDNYAYQANSKTRIQEQNNDYITIRPGFEVRITKHLRSNIYYNFRTLSSDQSDGFDNNQVCAQMTLSY